MTKRRQTTRPVKNQTVFTKEIKFQFPKVARFRIGSERAVGELPPALRARPGIARMPGPPHSTPDASFSRGPPVSLGGFRGSETSPRMETRLARRVRRPIHPLGKVVRLPTAPARLVQHDDPRPRCFRIGDGTQRLVGIVNPDTEKDLSPFLNGGITSSVYPGC
jgi:hypothetical protein